MKCVGYKQVMLVTEMQLSHVTV